MVDPSFVRFEDLGTAVRAEGAASRRAFGGFRASTAASVPTAQSSTNLVRANSMEQQSTIYTSCWN